MLSMCTPSSLTLAFWGSTRAGVDIDNDRTDVACWWYVEGVLQGWMGVCHDVDGWYYIRVYSWIISITGV